MRPVPCSKCGTVPAQMAITPPNVAASVAQGRVVPVCIPCARALASELNLPGLRAAADAEAARLARAIKLS